MEKRGLTSEEAKENLSQFGPNELTKKKETSVFKTLLSQFKSPLIYILAFAGLVTLFLKEWADTAVIWAAVLINAGLGFYQEFKAQKALQALRLFLAPKTKVIRDNQPQIIKANEIVPGDVVVLEIGVRVPADGYLIEATDMSFNEAILTGESMPVAKEIKKEVFMGTTIETGIGKMKVTKTGMRTKMGKIGQSLTEITEEKTPLQIQLAKLAKILALAVGAITILIFVSGEILGYGRLEMFTISVAVAVAAIPEGLAVTLTVILALGMQRILKRKALVRKLLAAETLGSVSVICADKTGTLTEGKMRVVKAETPNEDLLVKAAVLCNDMRDPLEIGMLDWAKTNPKLQTASEAKIADSETKTTVLKDRTAELKKQYPRLDEIPFSPKYKYIATLHQTPQKNEQLLFYSGAPEIILKQSQMSAKETQEWLKKFKDYGEKGYRLVGFAYRQEKNKSLVQEKESLKQKGKILNKEKVNLKNLNWLGILIYEDPVREGVKSALEESQKAGIEVKVITGDYAPTAAAVLIKLGLLTKTDQDKIMTGEELEKISEEEFQKRVEKIILFARTTPEQKLKIVKVLKNKGEVVAMTGDGVNDAPALKAADIGIVVGEASDVAKETADIILLDSNFKTIVHAIEEGRAIFENIKKVVLYLLSDSFTEVILIGGSILMKLPLPITAAQILWVNLVEDTLPSLALAFEPEEKEVMLEPPRSRQAPILDQEIKVLIFIIGLFTDLILFGLIFFLNRGLFHLHYLQTVIFATLAIDSLFYVFACRSLRKSIFQKGLFGNKALNLSVFIGFLTLISAIYLPFFQKFLKTHALGVKEWALILALGFFNLAMIEITKWVFIVRHKNDKLKK